MFVVNGRGIQQLVTLLNVLYSPEHHYLFHVDARSLFLYNEVVSLTRRYTNVYVTSWRYPTVWGGANLYEVYLRGLKDLLKLQWDFFLNLSESDFPIKPLRELQEFLNGYKDLGTNFLKSHGGPASGAKVDRFVKKQGLNRTFVQCDEHMFKVGSRELPAGLRIEGGSDWFILHRTFAIHLHSGDLFIEALRGWFDRSLLSAETFFHVALINGPLCHTFADANHRFANWRRSRGCKCATKAVVDWCGCSPMVLQLHDMDKLRDQATEKGMFFARKFDPTIS